MTQATSTGKYRDILESFSDGFPLLQKIYEVYQKSPAISKDQENTLRRSVEMTTLEVLELIVVASRQFKPAKMETLRHAANKLDTLKVFVDMAGQTGVIKDADAKDIQESVQHVGKMVGGWMKGIAASGTEK